MCDGSRGSLLISQDGVSKSLSQDRRRTAKTVVKRGKEIEEMRNLGGRLGVHAVRKSYHRLGLFRERQTGPT
jgi:hypothetical protein